MKYLCYIILAIGFIYTSSCISKKEFDLKNQKFLIGQNSSIKQEYLNFIDDSICVYHQRFNCNIDEKYRNTEIKCLYKISGNYIDLMAIEQPDFLVGKSCYAIPDSVLQKCDAIYVNTPEDPFYLTPEGHWDKAKAYGFINNINGTERLFYKKENLFYAKVLSCYGENTLANYQVFHKENKDELSNKTVDKIYFSGKVPLHR